MARAPCPRTWEAEAVEDGRLSNGDRASFERHASTCATCAREAEALASLRQTVRQVNRQIPDAVTLRRLRGALLQEAHRQRTRRARSPKRLGAVLVLAAAIAVLLAWGGLDRSRARLAAAPTGVSVADAPSFDVLDIDHAAVTSRTDGGATQATLADGIAAFHVAHVQAGRRFLLLLPDGEIEVRGTRFIVSVRDARTQSVEVTEGLVALRLRGLDGERVLAAGERWSLPPPSTSAGAAPSTTISPAAAPPRAKGRASPPKSRPAAGPDTIDNAGTRAAANAQFALAVNAFNEGSYARSDALLESFARRFPGDPRREDADFLRAMCHARLGDSGGAAALARAYLRTFPGGLRRREAEQLAGVR
jgi:hypothetical protein